MEVTSNTCATPPPLPLPVQAGGPVPVPPAAATQPASLVPILQQLTASLTQLVGVLQAMVGSGAIGGGDAACTGAASLGPLQQGPVQRGPVTPGPVAQRPAADAAGEAAGAGKPATFTIGSFNVLGASHTAGGKQHPSWRSGTERMPQMIAKLKTSGVDVAGMQEFQGSQQAAFRAAKPGYSMYAKEDNAIVWRTDKFDLVTKSSVSVPYFEGHHKEMPVALLKDKATGKQAYVISIHNPADTADHRHQGRYRAEALKIEQAYIKQLRATGTPVYIVGDFNDRAPAKQAMTAGGVMKSAAPAQARAGIDWLFGSGGTTFSDYRSDHAPVQGQYSDHPIVTATTTLT